MKQKLLCIELTSLDLRVCEVQLNTKSKETILLKHFSIPTTNMIGDDEIYEVDTLSYSLMEKLKENEIKTKKCIVSINSNHIYSRNVTVPYQRTSQELLSLVTAKVENDDIFSAADLAKSITTYSILEQIAREVVEEETEENTEEKPKKKKKAKAIFDYNVMLYNAPSDLIKDIVTLTKSCKLQLQAVNYSGNSIYQYMRVKHNKGTYLTVYLNDTNAIMSVIKDGIMVSQKTDDFSYVKVCKKLIEHQDVTRCSSVEECFKFFNDVKFFEEDYILDDELTETQKDTFYYMRNEIFDDILGFFDVVKAYLTSVRNTMPVDSVIYICNSEEFPDLTESIQVNLGIAVNKNVTVEKVVEEITNQIAEEVTELVENSEPEKPKGVEKKPKKDKKEKTPKPKKEKKPKKIDETVALIDESMPTALINCIYGCISPINFNIEDANRQTENIRIRQYTIFGVILTLWMSALYTGYNIITLSNLSTENKKLENDILAANEAQQVYNTYALSTYTLDTVTAFDDTSSTVLNEIDLVIEKLEKAVPTNKLHIDNLSCTIDSISMTIRADSKDTVAYFIENLEAIEYFDSIDVSSVSESISESGSESTFASGREVSTSVLCTFADLNADEEEFEYEELLNSNLGTGEELN
jgi:type IV pilus assembly protein PilM